MVNATSVESQRIRLMCAPAGVVKWCDGALPVGVLDTTMGPLGAIGRRDGPKGFHYLPVLEEEIFSSLENIEALAREGTLPLKRIVLKCMFKEFEVQRSAWLDVGERLVKEGIEFDLLLTATHEEAQTLPRKVDSLNSVNAVVYYRTSEEDTWEPLQKQPQA